MNTLTRTLAILITIALIAAGAGAWIEHDKKHRAAQARRERAAIAEKYAAMRAGIGKVHPYDAEVRRIEADTAARAIALKARQAWDAAARKHDDEEIDRLLSAPQR